MSLTRDQYRRIRLSQRKERRVPGGLIVHYLINVRSNYDVRPYPQGWCAIAKHKDFFFQLQPYIDRETPNYRQPNFKKANKQ